MLLGAFRGGNPLGRLVADAEFCPPSMLTVYQEGEMGVLRPSGGANAVAGCWPTYREQSPTSRFPANFVCHTTDPQSSVGFPQVSFLDNKQSVHAKPCTPSDTNLPGDRLRAESSSVTTRGRRVWNASIQTESGAAIAIL